MEWYYWLLIGICCFLSMFFSSADMVYGIVEPTKLENKIKIGKQVKRAQIALKITKDYEFSISAILFGNNVVNIFASSIITIIGLYYGSQNPNIGGDLGVTLFTIGFTIFLIIFCEFLPKAFAKRFNLSLSILFAYPVLFVKYLTIIFVWPISKLFVLLGVLFKKRSKEEDTIDEEVLTEMVDTIEEQGLLEEGEAEIVRSAIDLNDIQAFEIMTPRVDVFSINAEDDIEEILKEPNLFKHSRVPVYKDTIDNIVGILPIKSLAKTLLKGHKNDINILSLCYKPIIVPRNHQVLDLLEEFRTTKIHIAVIKDEYGGTEGIVTMEDILEEIVGDIFDENDEIEEEYIEKGNGVYIVDGSMNLDDFFELIEFNGEFETDYSTVGGFCQEILDRFAKVGDEFDFEHYHFKITEADDFTVEKLKVVDNDFLDIEDNI